MIHEDDDISKAKHHGCGVVTMNFKVKAGATVATILAVCVAGYLIGSLTEIRTDLVETRENGTGIPGEAKELRLEEYLETDERAGGMDAVLTATVIYNGKIGGGLIEAEMDDGVVRTFRLGSGVMEIFDGYGFRPGNVFRIIYREVEGQNPVILRIEE